MITETFEYDNQNRLKIHKHKVDNNPQEEILAQNEYNELSQLTGKKVGGSTLGTGLQEVNYQYNIRGWMTQINDPANLGTTDLFGYKINYNQVEGMENPHTDYMELKVKPKFNGNIAEVSWKTATTPNDNLRRYGYVYDGLNRLQAGFYQKDNNPSAREYFEKIDYDLNGNISHLQRSGALLQNYSITEAFDDLTYHYENNNTSNRLSTVTDASVNYGGYPEIAGNTIPYDLNGNMTSHVDKGILGIDYNYLNLPKYILFQEGLSTRTGIIRNNTSYLYRADGVKLKKTYKYAPYNPLGIITKLSTEETEYIDGFQYNGGVQDSPKGGTLAITTLAFRPTAEGYYDFVKNKYIYNYTDHLGNVRLSYFNNGSGIEILEENNYYPFGLKHEGYNSIMGNLSYQYKYNGKELQTESGMYDYGARFYMPDLGRWGVVDPLSEKMRRYSPYNYAFNNPIRFIDPDGRQGTDWVRQTSNGASTWTYDPNIQTVAQAEAAGYQDVTAVTSSATISRESTLGMGGYSYSLNSDGSVINNSDGSGINNTFVTGAGTTINAPSGTFMGEHKLDLTEKWANSSNFFAKFSYGIANNAYVTAQIFDGGLMERPEWSNPLGGNYGNLDGTPNYQQADALVNTVATAAPYARGAKAVNSLMPEGLSILSRFAPATGARGVINNTLNRGVDAVNGTVGKGMIARPIVTAAGNAAKPDSPVRTWLRRNVGYRPQFD